MIEVVDIFENSKPVHPLAVGEDWTRDLLERLGERVGVEMAEFAAQEARLREKEAAYGVAALLRNRRD